MREAVAQGMEICSEWWRLESHARAAIGKQEFRTQRAREGGQSQDEWTDGCTSFGL